MSSTHRGGGTHSAAHGLTMKTLTRVGDHVRPESWHLTLAEDSLKTIIEHIDTDPLPDTDGTLKIFHIETVLAIEYPE